VLRLAEGYAATASIRPEPPAYARVRRDEKKHPRGRRRTAVSARGLITVARRGSARSRAASGKDSGARREGSTPAEVFKLRA
jgi:hypothetical protein